MALVLTQEGAAALWRQTLGIAPLIGIPNLHLMGTAGAPLHAWDYATFQALELSAAGYAELSLGAPATSWAIATIAQGASATRLAGPFPIAVATTIYGYWLADQTDTYSLWGEGFSTPYSYNPLGGAFYLNLLPQLVSLP